MEPSNTTLAPIRLQHMSPMKKKIINIYKLYKLIILFRRKKKKTRIGGGSAAFHLAKRGWLCDIRRCFSKLNTLLLLKTEKVELVHYLHETPLNQQDFLEKN
jgi:hypothetical protein